jgi:hypothetical protein
MIKRWPRGPFWPPVAFVHPPDDEGAAGFDLNSALFGHTGENRRWLIYGRCRPVIERISFPTLIVPGQNLP